MRSAICKEACSVINLLAETFQERFEPTAERFLCKDSLFKSLNCGNKVILDHVHSSICTIIENVISSKFIGKITEEFASKNPSVRVKCSEYIDKLIENYP